MHTHSKSVVVFSGSYVESITIKNLLESNNVEVFQDNSLMSTIEPWAVSPGGFNAAVLKISSENYERAIEIINDYNNGERELK